MARVFRDWQAVDASGDLCRKFRALRKGVNWVYWL